MVRGGKAGGRQRRRRAVEDDDDEAPAARFGLREDQGGGMGSQTFACSAGVRERAEPVQPAGKRPRKADSVLSGPLAQLGDERPPPTAGRGRRRAQGAGDTISVETSSELLESVPVECAAGPSKPPPAGRGRGRGGQGRGGRLGRSASQHSPATEPCQLLPALEDMTDEFMADVGADTGLTASLWTSLQGSTSPEVQAINDSGTEAEAEEPAAASPAGGEDQAGEPAVPPPTESEHEEEFCFFPDAVAQPLAAAKALEEAAPAEMVGCCRVASSPTPKAQVTGSTPLCFSATGLDLSAAERRMIKDLGAAFTSDWGPEVTHLVADTFRRTTKMMCAICCGARVVVPTYLEACAKAGRIVDDAAFLLADTVCEAAFARKHHLDGYSLARALEQRRRAGPLLHGISVYCFPSVVEKHDLPQLVAAAGGTWLAEPPAAVGGSAEEAAAVLLLAERAAGAGPEPRQGPTRRVYDVELLREAAMTQVLRRRAWRLA